MSILQLRINAKAWRAAALLALCFVASGGVPQRSSAAGSDATPAATMDHRFGVVEAWRQPGAAADLNVGWERLTMWWKSFQPSGPNDWNDFATGHDSYINSEIASGRQLVGELINTPDWAAANLQAHGNSIPKGLYLPFDDPNNYWGHFVELIVKHYAGRIDQWVLWNEVNIPSGKYSTWTGTVQDYAQLVKVAYLAAHQVNPNAQIILFGDPYWYDHGAFFRKLLSILTADPGSASHQAYFDVANLHLYNRPKDYMTVIDLYRKWMAQYGLNKPIWIGETNAVPYNDPVRTYPKSGFFSTLDDQTTYIVEAFSLAMALNVQRIEVNRMIDGQDFVLGGEPFGLLRNDMSRRPEFQTYKFITTLLKGVTGGVIRSDEKTGIYEVDLRKSDSTIVVVWNQTPAALPVSIPALAPQAVIYDKFGTSKSVSAKSGQYSFVLQAATDNSDPANPKDYVVSGSPVILVETN